MGRDVDESELLDVEDDRLGIRIRPSWAPKPNKSSKPRHPPHLVNDWQVWRLRVAWVQQVWGRWFRLYLLWRSRYLRNHLRLGLSWRWSRSRGPFGNTHRPSWAPKPNKSSKPPSPQWNLVNDWPLFQVLSVKVWLIFRRRHWIGIDWSNFWLCIGYCRTPHSKIALRLVSDDVLEFGRGILRFNIGAGLLFALEFCEGFWSFAKSGRTGSFFKGCLDFCPNSPLLGFWGEVVEV